MTAASRSGGPGEGWDLARMAALAGAFTWGDVARTVPMVAAVTIAAMFANPLHDVFRREGLGPHAHHVSRARRRKRSAAFR